ncbi:hypothetical protein PanWU01x14_283930 [Parasponia andersonii]|uniref:Uncharacterized protein n=1 Tax=Parasponia andersonii TaxID=3476 RepID=A0A2P5B028_PARAD|nr:hypothetical protein PanWU01x14_283930 [Parasponia andersonii]
MTWHDFISSWRALTHHLVDLADTWPCNNFHVAPNLDGYDFTPERRILKGVFSGFESGAAHKHIYHFMGAG